MSTGWLIACSPPGTRAAHVLAGITHRQKLLIAEHVRKAVYPHMPVGPQLTISLNVLEGSGELCVLPFVRDWHWCVVQGRGTTSLCSLFPHWTRFDSSRDQRLNPISYEPWALLKWMGAVAVSKLLHTKSCMQMNLLGQNDLNPLAATQWEPGLFAFLELEFPKGDR